MHQYQRPVKTATVQGTGDVGEVQTLEYIEATLADIQLANQIAHEVLGRSLDELPPQTRRVLAGVQALVQEKMGQEGLPQREVRFTRCEVRAATGLSDTQARIHLQRLTDLEYLLVHRGQRGQSYVYELLHDQPQSGSGHSPYLAGLIDVAALQAAAQSASTTTSSRGAAGELAGHKQELAQPTRPQSGANAQGQRTTAKPPPARQTGITSQLPATKPVHTGQAHGTPTPAASFNGHASYPQGSLSVAPLPATTLAA